MKTWVAFVLAGLPGSPSQYIQSSNPAHVFLLAVPQLASKLAFFFSVFAWFLVFLAGREIVRDRETEREGEREVGEVQEKLFSWDPRKRQQACSKTCRKSCERPRASNMLPSITFICACFPASGKFRFEAVRKQA